MTNSHDPIIRDLEIMADTVNYRKWIYGNIKEALGARVIELGAGIGNFTQLLTDREIVVPIDNSQAAVEQMRKKFSEFPNVVPRRVDIEGPELLGLREYEADTIVCINVLEHIRDDVAALSNMLRILKTGNKLVLLVPAYQFLFGSIDRVVGHYRRYSKKELSTKIAEAGFTVCDSFFMNFFGVLPWFLNNVVTKRQEESRAQMMLFDKYFCPWLNWLEDRVRPPFGLSLIGIGEKK
jgi:SAM-dependent methyltransferase